MENLFMTAALPHLTNDIDDSSAGAVLLILSILPGIVTFVGYILACKGLAETAREKGHQNANPVAMFFFGVPYMLYIAGLPDLKSRSADRNVINSNPFLNDSGASSANTAVQTSSQSYKPSLSKAPGTAAGYQSSSSYTSAPSASTGTAAGYQSSSSYTSAPSASTGTAAGYQSSSSYTSAPSASTGTAAGYQSSSSYTSAPSASTGTAAGYQSSSSYTSAPSASTGTAAGYQSAGSYAAVSGGAAYEDHSQTDSTSYDSIGTGWLCPNCGRANSILSKTCTCGAEKPSV